MKDPVRPLCSRALERAAKQRMGEQQLEHEKLQRKLEQSEAKKKGLKWQLEEKMGPQLPLLLVEFSWLVVCAACFEEQSPRSPKSALAFALLLWPLLVGLRAAC